jgi:penicillin-binding protein 1C
MTINPILKQHWRWSLTAAAVLLTVSLWIIFGRPPQLNEYPASLYICDRSGSPMRTILGPGDMRCIPVTLAAGGEWTAKALIAAEDKRFYSHGGVDAIAAVRALAQNLVYCRRVSGASTISTQVIRMNSPRSRNLSTKAIESVSAVRMERELSKDQILEQYLNRMPQGGNLVGVQAAAVRYFGRDAADLSLAEAALLAGLPQAPSRFRPDRRLKRALKRRAFVLERMQKLGFITAEQQAAAENQVPDIKPHPDEFRAPHFCEFVMRHLNVSGDRRNVTTTLDAEMQGYAETALQRHLPQLHNKDAFGGAVVVIDVASGAVAAMVGSPDYDDLDHAGRVNCAVMPRSPGSALKPVAYVMALDRGLITPGKVVDDSPIYFKDYIPKNFDYKFRGRVSVRRALADSLNIPALTLVNSIGLNKFVGCLQQLGLDSLNRTAEDYGLAVVLGSGEVKLINLVNAYACLARQGIYLPYRVLPSAPNASTTVSGRRVFSSGAAWMIADMLSGDERLTAISGNAADIELPRIAWKTGTSSGARDAWTVGYNPEYVVGVWLGNPDGCGSDGLLGVEDAAPIVMDVFRRIYPDGNSPWYDRPDTVAVRKVCPDSGCPAGRGCKSAVDDFYMPGVSDPAKCSLHRRGTSKIGPGDPLAQTEVRIRQPQNGEVFVLSDDIDASLQRISLTADCGDAGKLCWFVDGSPLASGSAAASWQLKKGRHEIICVLPTGKSDTVNITVE